MSGKKKVDWVPDHLAKRCTLCCCEFTFFKRQHHCRRCGRVFCDACSSKNIRLVYHGHPGERVRVCNNCFPQAQRELEFHDRHLPRLRAGSPFTLKVRMRPDEAIIMKITQDEEQLVWHPAKLDGNKASKTKAVPIIDITDVRPTPGVGGPCSLEITAGRTHLKLDAATPDDCKAWVVALQEAGAMHKLRRELQNTISQTHKTLSRDEQQRQILEAEQEKMSAKQERAQKRDSIRQKYGLS